MKQIAVLVTRHRGKKPVEQLVDGAGDVDKLWHAFHRMAVAGKLNGKLANAFRGHGDDA